MIITSKDNNEIKRVKKLYEKKYREEENSFIIDGIKIFNEAVREKAQIEKVFYCKELLEKNSQLTSQAFFDNLEKYEKIEIPEILFKHISELQNPQGIIAIVKKKENQEINFNHKLYLALDDIQDPGNMGTIIRTADSCGINQIICSKDTADCFNSKVIRATMGAIFRVNIIYKENLKEMLEEFKEKNIKVLVTDLSASKTIYEVDLKKSIMVIGNEANGVSKEILEIATNKIKIPMEGRAESLNAAVATGIIIYEAKRQINYNK